MAICKLMTFPELSQTSSQRLAKVFHHFQAFEKDCARPTSTREPRAAVFKLVSNKKKKLFLDPIHQIWLTLTTMQESFRGREEPSKNCFIYLLNSSVKVNFVVQKRKSCDGKSPFKWLRQDRGNTTSRRKETQERVLFNSNWSHFMT